MSRYQGPFTRRNHGRGHSYTDANGQKVPGVTTLINKGLPKPALTNWAAGCAAEYAVDHWDQLASLDISDRLKRIKAAPNETRDAAALRGSKLHDLADRLDLDKLVRAVCDALTGIAYRDDAQVVQLAASKHHGELPGVHIRLEPIEQADPQEAAS